MTPEQQRVAIAEALGAKWFEVPEYKSECGDDFKRYHPRRVLCFFTPEFDHPLCAPLPFPDPKGDALWDIPDYLSDLNACHFKDQLDKREQDIFAVHLAKIVCNEENRIERG